MLLLVSSSFASRDEIYLNEGPSSVLYQSLNPIELNNRSSCAKESRFPAKTSFLFLNNTNVAKAAYRFAKVTDQNSSKVTKDIIIKFRHKMIKLYMEVHNNIVTGKIPLLPVISEKSYVPPEFNSITQSCYEKKRCHELDTYLESIWNAKGKVTSLLQVDNFHLKDSFFSNTQKSNNENINCVQLSKFSPLQAHLYGAKPDRKVLNQIVTSLYEQEENISSCLSSKIDNLAVGTYQFDIKNIENKYWKKVGFDYWNSLKLYLSWAFRNIEIFDAKSERILMNTDISDALLLASNGCRSIEAPECSNDYIAKNVVRDFSRKDFEKNAEELDILKPIVNGAQDNLLDDPFTAVNTDILNFADYENSTEWLKNIYDNFSKTKSYLRHKVVSAVNFYHILKHKVQAPRVIYDLNAYYKNKNLNNPLYKNDLYFMCSEVNLAAHENFGLALDQIDLVKDSSFLNSHQIGFSSVDMREVYQTFKWIIRDTIDFCNSFDKEFWVGKDIDESGHSAWYLLKTKPETKSRRDDILSSINDKPYLSFKNSKTPLCHSPSDCVRKSVEYMLDLSRAVHYSATFWNGKNSIRSSELFNPYAERTVCKVYDPWYKSKSIMTKFVSDISQAAISYFTPGVLYSNFSLKPGYVTSFNKMIKDGKILFDKKMSKQKIIKDLAVEFGPLLGAPCAVSISKDRSNVQDLYHFVGVSVGLCSNSENSQIDVYSAGDIRVNEPDKGGACFSCRLNFESISNSLSFFDVTLGPAFYMVRAFVRLFKSYKDPHNISRSYNVDFDKLIETHRRYGIIPEKCVKKLRKGKSCTPNSKERALLRYLGDRFNNKIKSFEPKRNSYLVNFEGCLKPIEIHSERNRSFFEVSGPENKCLRLKR